MDWLNEPLLVGTWVKIELHMLKNFTGFITKFDHEEEQYHVQLTKNAQGKQTAGILWVESEYVVPADDESQYFRSGLIDTTLDLKQKEWFLELTEKLPLENH
jgi:hypothetical protein